MRPSAFTVQQQFKVLLLDRSPHDLQGLMDGAGYAVTEVHDTFAAAAKLADEQQPDIIVASWQDGAQELLHQMNCRDDWRSIPLVVTSTEAYPEAVVGALQAGAADFLTKPLRSNELATLWQHVWRRRNAATAAAAQPTLAKQQVAELATLSNASGGSDGSTGCQFQLSLQSASSKPASTPPHSPLRAVGTSNTPPSASLAHSLLPPPQAGALPQSAGTCALRGAPPGTSFPLFHRSASPPPASPTSTSRSAPASVCAIATGCANDDAASLPAAAALRTAGGVRKHAAQRVALVPASVVSAALGSLCSGSICSASGELAHIDLSIRPLDVSPPPPAAAVSHQLSAAESASLLQGMPGFGALGNLSCVAPHNRLPGKGGWSAISQRSGSSPRGSSASSATAAGFSGGTCCPPPPARASSASRSIPLPPPADAPDAAGQQARAEYKAACAAHRKAAIVKFRQKRESRNFDKKVRYVSRKRLAESRPRVRGQFVKAEVAAACRALTAAQEGSELGKAGAMPIAVQ